MRRDTFLWSSSSSLARTGKSPAAPAWPEYYVTLTVNCNFTPVYSEKYRLWTLATVKSSDRMTSRHCSLQLRQSQPVGICGPLISVIWPHRKQELWALVHEVSRLLAHQCGTVCRRSSRTRHWLLDTSWASWRQKCLHEATTHQRSRRNFLL